MTNRFELVDDYDLRYGLLWNSLESNDFASHICLVECLTDLEYIQERCRRGMAKTLIDDYSAILPKLRMLLNGNTQLAPQHIALQQFLTFVANEHRVFSRYANQSELVIQQALQAQTLPYVRADAQRIARIASDVTIALAKLRYPNEAKAGPGRVWSCDTRLAMANHRGTSVVTVAFDGTMHLRNPLTGVITDNLPNVGHDPLCLDISPTHDIAAIGNRSGSISIVSIDGNYAMEFMLDYGNAVSSISISEQGDIVVAGNQRGDLYVVDVAQKRITQRMASPRQATLQHLEISPCGGKCIAAYLPQELSVKDISNGVCLWDLMYRRVECEYWFFNYPECMVVDWMQHKFYVIDDRHTMQCFNFNSKSSISTWDVCSSKGLSASITLDNECMQIGCADGLIHRVRLSDGHNVGQVRVGSSGIEYCEIDQINSLVFTRFTLQSRMDCWNIDDIRSGELYGSLNYPVVSVQPLNTKGELVVSHPDRSLALIGVNNKVTRLYEGQNTSVAHRQHQRVDPVSAIHGRMGHCAIINDRDCGISVIECDSGQVVQEISGYPYFYTDVQYVGKGDSLIAVREDGALDMIHSNDGTVSSCKEIHHIGSRGAEISIQACLANRYVVSQGKAERCLRIYDLYAQEVCQSRMLSPEELMVSIFPSGYGVLTAVPNQGFRGVWFNQPSTWWQYNKVYQHSKLHLTTCGTKVVVLNDDASGAVVEILSLHDIECQIVGKWRLNSDKIIQSRLLYYDGMLGVLGWDGILEIWDLKMQSRVHVLAFDARIASFSTMTARGCLWVTTDLGEVWEIKLEVLADSKPKVVPEYQWQWTTMDAGNWDAHPTYTCSNCGEVVTVELEVEQYHLHPCLHCGYLHQLSLGHPQCVSGSDLQNSIPYISDVLMSKAVAESVASDCIIDINIPYIIDQVDRLDAWLTVEEVDEMKCAVCHSAIEGYAISTETENIVCSDCVEKALECIADSTIVSEMAPSAVLAGSLGEQGVLVHLAILRKIRTVYRHVCTSSTHQGDQLLEAVALGLGYSCGHPLDHYMRWKSRVACVDVGISIAYVIERVSEEERWNFLANGMTAMAEIDIHHPVTHRLIMRGVKSNHNKLREWAVRALHDHDLPWTRELVLQLTDDECQDVRDVATETMDRWDIWRGDMESKEIDLREIVLRYVATGDIDTRRQIRRQLQGRRSWWSRKLIQKMLND